MQVNSHTCVSRLYLWHFVHVRLQSSWNNQNEHFSCQTVETDAHIQQSDLRRVSTTWFNVQVLISSHAKNTVKLMVATIIPLIPLRKKTFLSTSAKSMDMCKKLVCKSYSENRGWQNRLHWSATSTFWLAREEKHLQIFTSEIRLSCILPETRRKWSHSTWKLD